MDHADLRILLDYHYWARDRILGAIQTLSHEQYTTDLGNSFKSVRDTAVHVYSAEWAWHSRWMGNSPPKPVAPESFPDVESLRRAWIELERQMRALLDAIGEEGVDRVYAY